MDWAVVLTISVIYAVVFFVLFCAVVVGGVLVAPDAMVQDYPPAIRERYGPKSERGERVGRVLAVLMLVLVVGVTAAAASTLDQRLGDVGFWPGFVFGAVFFILLHVLDLVILDWWLFCRVQPRFVVLPGTEGMPEYRDWRFHYQVLIPRPVPWPLLLIPAYGLLVGAGTAFL